MTPDLGKAMAMARTIWKGALSFGLVNVPVGLYPATQDKNIHFNQLEAGTSDRIRYRKVNERTGQEVESSKIVKGFDLGGGEYVILSDDELAAAEPQKSRLIEITDFVDLEEIDPIYFRSTYYLAPEGEAASKAYGLLRQVMSNANKVAIGTLVMRNKEYPVAIRPGTEVLEARNALLRRRDQVTHQGAARAARGGRAERPRDLDGPVAPRIDGERMESGEVRRHPPPEGGSHHRGEAPGQRSGGPGDQRPGHAQGRRSDGGVERQHRFGQVASGRRHRIDGGQERRPTTSALADQEDSQSSQDRREQRRRCPRPPPAGRPRDDGPHPVLHRWVPRSTGG